MPYINQADRLPIASKAQSARKAGELNYAITLLLIDYYEYVGPGYQAINDIRGAVAGAQAEFETRVARPYEDRKIRDNGDVYPEWMVKGL